MSVGDAKPPSSATTCRFADVLFVHWTTSPESTVIFAGWNALPTIFTEIVAAELDAGNTSTSVAAASMRIRFN